MESFARPLVRLRIHHHPQAQNPMLVFPVILKANEQDVQSLKPYNETK